ncbi:MAG: hypothetical protein WCG21_02535 [Eubacteriales bacterium]
MGQRLDRVMYRISVIYIALPIFIFLASWLRLIVAVPVCIIFLVSLFLMIKNQPEPIKWHITRAQWCVVAVSVIILALWVFFSGIGGFSFQNIDYHDRNAIFRDLIDRSWPVIYNFSPDVRGAMQGLIALPEQGVLSYYIAFWLPAALAGKVFGWYAANAVLYFWALSGVLLIVYYIFRTLRRVSIRSVLIFIFFSGLDIVGYLLINKGAVPSLVSHIEWWAGYQYSSNTTLLFWVFNQALIPWLAIMLLMNMKNSRSLFFMYALLLLYGPFPFMGMLPFVLWKAYTGYPLSIKTQKLSFSALLKQTGGWIWGGIRRALTFENIAGGISVLVITGIYFSNNVSSGRYMGVNSIVPAYFSFFALEAGLYLLLLFAYFRKYPVYWICLISLILIPLFQVGIYQDFCMRVSIPALFMTQFLIQKVLAGKMSIEGKDENTALAQPEHAQRETASRNIGSGHFFAVSGQDQRIISFLLSVMLCIGAVVPVQEIARSLWNTFPEYAPTHNAMSALGETMKNSNVKILVSWGNSLVGQSSNGQLWADEKKSLQNVDIIMTNEITTLNYIATTEGNIFCGYLAREPS